MERKYEKEVNERKKGANTEKLWAVGQPSFSGHNQHLSIHSEKFFGQKRFGRQALLSLVRDCTISSFPLSAESTS